MTSSSTDPTAGTRRHPFLEADRGSWVRLAVVLAFAVAALVAPFVGSTQAQFTDHATVEIRYQVGPTTTPTPTADPSSAPTAGPTADSATVSTQQAAPGADGPSPVSRTAQGRTPRLPSGGERPDGSVDAPAGPRAPTGQGPARGDQD